MFANSNTAPEVEVVWTTVHVESYSNYLTGFHEPLSPLYRSLDVTPVCKMSSVITDKMKINWHTNALFYFHLT